MRRLSSIVLAVTFLFLATFSSPLLAQASGGYMSPSGGGKFVTGQTFTIKVTAAGASFNAFQGQISVSGPVSIVSFSQGSYSLINGKVGNGSSFAAYVTSSVSSLTVATIQLKGTKEGTGSVSVSGVRLANSGTEVGTTGGSTSFTIGRAPTVPGEVTVTSATNPDQNQTYGVTAVDLSWTAPNNGATGYSTVFDATADTVPPTTVTTTDLKAHYDNPDLGTHYFHIRAVNGDGWGPTTHYKIMVGPAVDGGLGIPVINGLTKLDSFTNDVTAGTLTNFAINGTAPGLAGYTVTLAFVPANLPAEQKLDSTVADDGSWQVVFDHPIASGFYKVTAQVTKEKTTTATSAPVNIELSVANGGTVKIITSDDLPKPDLTVKVAGVTFKDKSHLHWAEGWIAGLLLLFALLGIGGVFGYQFFRARLKRTVSTDRPVRKI